MFQRILKAFVKSPPKDAEGFARGFTTKPIAPWKKNTFAILTGTVMGLYMGQYFPEIYFDRVSHYLP
jgi:hypothetical protein